MGWSLSSTKIFCFFPLDVSMDLDFLIFLGSFRPFFLKTWANLRLLSGLKSF